MASNDESNVFVDVVFDDENIGTAGTAGGAGVRDERRSLRELAFELRSGLDPNEGRGVSMFEAAPAAILFLPKR